MYKNKQLYRTQLFNDKSILLARNWERFALR